MTLTLLACSVRGCHQPLTRHNRSYACDRGHSFDIARSGYLNLLQPQDRRSKQAGDSPASLDARSRLLARGIGRHVLDAAVAATAGLDATTPVVVDLGCGTGEALGALTAQRPAHGVGIDLSTHAAALAAKRYPNSTWVVANADRRIPVLDGVVDAILSIHARRNPAECRRILAPSGRLIVAVPAPDDLIELRALVQGKGVARVRSPGVEADHAPHFTLVERHIASAHHRLAGQDLEDLLRSTYRAERGRHTRTTASTEIDVTVASEILEFTPR